jgi:hypothetical protein
MAHSFKKNHKKDPMRYVVGSGMIFSLLGLILIVSLALLVTNDKLHLVSVLQKVQNAQEVQQQEAADRIAVWQTADGEEYALSIGEQVAGDSVMIDGLNFPTEAWVVFHADDNGEPGVILSAYRFNEGTVKNWAAELIDGVSLTPGATYHAMIHEQQGGVKFNYTADLPILDADGNAMTLMFTVAQ